MRIGRALKPVWLAGCACVALFAAARVSWSETLTTAASPNFTLSDSFVRLNDSATLSGASNPTGLIRFSLTGPGGLSFTQTDAVIGNFSYPAGMNLGTGIVAGTYIWNVSYSGDANNSPVLAPTEETVVSPAIPGLNTTASADSLGGFIQLTDTAQLSGGYFPTGSMEFVLTAPDGSSVTTTDAVSGNGSYGAVLPGTLDGTYIWRVLYTGDANNVATIETEAVTLGATPETPLPGTLALFATGIGGLGLLGWRGRRKSRASAT